ncbi:MAG: hypothetical protein R3B48_15155 [Kofleriaceae bacterium]
MPHLAASLHRVLLFTLHRALLFTLALSALVAISRTTAVRAQTLERAAPPSPVRAYGLELDVVQPFVPTVHIIKPKLSVHLWGDAHDRRGELIVGLYLRPHIEHDVVETIDEYMLVAGYRQYLWRGLHAEVLLDGGLAWGKNKVDQRDYTTPTLFLDANVGYRVTLLERGGPVGLYVAPQLGVIGSLGLADIGPRNGKPDWFLQGNLLVGARF